MQIEEYIAQCISTCADIYAVPGGPVALDPMLMESQALETAFRFLVEHHELKSTWLIAHQGCAWYVKREGLQGPRSIYELQVQDLGRAASRVRMWFPKLEVNLAYASLDGDRVRIVRLSR